MKINDITGPKLKTALNASQVTRNYKSPPKTYTRGPYTSKIGELSYQVYYPDGKMFNVTFYYPAEYFISNVETVLRYTPETGSMIGKTVKLPEACADGNIEQFSKCLRNVHDNY